MGYRSEVLIVTDLINQELVEILENENDYSEKLQFQITDVRTNKEIDCLMIKWDYAKWYDGYEDVDRIMNAINKIEDEDSFGFIRIGEEFVDVEVIGNPYDFNYVITRKIECMV